MPIPERKLYEERQAAESFGTDAERYDRSRPRYPDEMITRVLAGAGEHPAVLDVGCGTGIAARQFQSAGGTVLGVDVDERMAAVARRLGTDVEVSPFERWDPAGRTFDVVVSGQTWHWIDPVAGAAAAARVLRPGGRLAIFWNVFEPPAPIRDAFAEAHTRFMPEFPLPGSAAQAYAAMAGTAEDGIRATAGLGEPEIWRFARDHVYTRDEWLDQVPTQGLYTRLPPERLRPLLDALGAAIDAAGGSFTASLGTVVVTTTRSS
ncbi:class I SAM-dependent methyltransferase [Actinoplanes sp. RD1]|uniref:class I SAM-dependent methyltransferase n=1 Tax=Actinoplanes sp. RD1 TaxID=3064538 RepID=UPI002740658E|nr:class I SAM-dependent methyltransferase [Actinoplanes sp. RD1]